MSVTVVNEVGARFEVGKRALYGDPRDDVEYVKQLCTVVEITEDIFENDEGTAARAVAYVTVAFDNGEKEILRADGYSLSQDEVEYEVGDLYDLDPERGLVTVARVAALEGALRRAADVVKNLVEKVPEFTGVVGPGGEREDESIRDGLHDEAEEWVALADARGHAGAKGASCDELFVPVAPTIQHPEGGFIHLPTTRVMGVDAPDLGSPIGGENG